MPPFAPSRIVYTLRACYLSRIMRVADEGEMKNAACQKCEITIMTATTTTTTTMYNCICICKYAYTSYKRTNEVLFTML